MKGMGIFVGKFGNEPLKSAKILFCGCGLKCFSPLRGSNRPYQGFRHHLDG